MTLDFYDNLQKATSNLSDITFEKYGTVTKISDDKVSVLVDDSLEHDSVPVLNGIGVSEGDRVVLGFVNNNNYNPVVYGVLGKVAGGSGFMGSFHISDEGNLIVTIPSNNPYRINEDGDLIYDTSA